MKLLRSISSTEMEDRRNQRIVWKLVLTGGPCGGKTTGQARLSTFFENLGWKVYRVPETANVLLGGGVDFHELSQEAATGFQENLLKTMLQIENSFFDLANATERNCLVICDRGALDASAFIPREQWEMILANNNFDEIELRDNRYHQVVHLVSASKGAEQFYSTEQHETRIEGLQEARFLDTRASEAWIGHPYVDILDNSSDFESKIKKLISVVAWRMGAEIGDRLVPEAKKAKFVVNGPLPSDSSFPPFRDFKVCHHYLQASTRTMQIRIRRRGLDGKWNYTHTIRKQANGQNIEVKSPLTQRDYTNLISQQDPNHYVVYKTRRCFVYNDQYFQLDIYKEPYHNRCKGLMLLETYTTLSGHDLQTKLPTFLNLGDEVTGDSAFSMFNLSLKGDWLNNKKFCHKLSEDEDNEMEHMTTTQEAEDRLVATKSRQSSPSGPPTVDDNKSLF